MMHLIKFAFVFALGGVIALLAARWILNSYNPKVLGQETSVLSVEKVRDAQANFVAKFLYNDILPAVAQSPVLAPLFETKRSVEESIEAVGALPEAQKRAVCQELCGEALELKRTPRPAR